MSSRLVMAIFPLKAKSNLAKPTILRQLYCSWRRIYLGPVCRLSIDGLLLHSVALLTRYFSGGSPAEGCAPFSYGTQLRRNCSWLSRLDRFEQFGDAELVKLWCLDVFKGWEVSWKCVLQYQFQLNPINCSVLCAVCSVETRTCGAIPYPYSYHFKN